MVKREIISIFPKKILCNQMQKVGVNSRKGEYFIQIMTLLWLKPQYIRAEMFNINSYRH